MEGSMRLHAVALGVAFGVVGALFLFLLGAAGIYAGTGGAMIQTMSSLYHGYAATWVGACFGAVWGFVIGFIEGYIAAYIYNFVSSRQ